MGKRKGSNKTSQDTYQVTPAGTRLFRVLTNPEYFNLNVTELCEEANVARSTYYRLTKNKAFMEDVKKEQERIVGDNGMRVLMATMVYALTESGNHADRKMLLKWAGIYDEEVTTNLKGGLDVKDTSSRLMEYLTEDLVGKEEGEEDGG